MAGTLIPTPEDMSWLDQLFALRQLADAHLDASFSTTSLPAGSRLLLFNEADAGFGDVAFATRLLHLLGRYEPDVETSVVSSRPDKQRILGLPAGVTMHGFEELDSAADPLALAPSIVVSAPGIFDHCRFEAPVYERLGLAAGPPFLYLAEYGSIRQLRDDTFKDHMGAIGVAIEAAMDEAAARHDLSADDMGYRGRTGEIVAATDEGVRTLGHLAPYMVRRKGPLHDWATWPVSPARSTGLEVGELGLQIDDELVATCVHSKGPESRPTLAQLEDPVLAALLANQATDRSLYFGYAYSNLGRFIDIAAGIERGSARDLDVVMPNARPPADTWLEAFNPARLARLQATGIGRIEVIGNGAETDDAHGVAGAQSLVHDLGPGRTLRLINRYPILNADWRRLLLASAPPTMVAGDQSVSDAVSADKAIVLMEPVYSQTWLIDAFVALAERTDPDLAATLRFGLTARWDADAWQQVETILDTDQLVASARRLNATIRDQHDARPAMIHAIRRCFWSHLRPSLADLQRRLLVQAWQDFEPAQGLRLDTSELAEAINKLS